MRNLPWRHFKFSQNNISGNRNFLSPAPSGDGRKAMSCLSLFDVGARRPQTAGKIDVISL
jgi:hypothetical protein